MNTVITLFLLFLITITTYSQSSYYDIYVMTGCGNCALAKQNLDKNLPDYQFHNTDSQVIGRQMLLKLHQLGYQGKIRMPVIIQDDSVLIHPAQKVNEEYIAVDLIKVLENIKKSKLEFGSESSATSKCDFKEENLIYYLVCGNFDTEEKANHLSEVLVSRGYSQANTIFFNRLFRVYTHVFQNKGDADEMLQQVRTQYKGAYVLTEKLN